MKRNKIKGFRICFVFILFIHLYKSNNKLLTTKNKKTMETIVIGQDYKIKQIENTQRQINYLLNIGLERVTLEEMQNMLSDIGLKLDLNINGYLNLYYNTNNANKYYEATTSPLDSKKISAYNTNSEFYNKHLTGFRTTEAETLYKLRINYFCTYKKGSIEYILSF